MALFSKMVNIFEKLYREKEKFTVSRKPKLKISKNPGGYNF